MSEDIKQKTRLTLRIGLMTSQILLPLGLYFAMRAGDHFMTAAAAGLFGVSMLVLIWQG
jgi:hypothetical protein